MKIKRLKELIKNIPDNVDVYFMFGLNDKYKEDEYIQKVLLQNMNGKLKI